MQRKLSVVILAILSLCISASLAAAQGRSCGTPEVSKQSVISNTLMLDYYHGLNSGEFSTNTIPAVDVEVYLVRDSGNDNTATTDQVSAQIAVLNNAWENRFIFNLTGIQEINSSYDYVYYGTDAETEMKSYRHWSAATLNLYIVDTVYDTGILGWATFPEFYYSDPQTDGVAIDFRTLPGGPLEGYNEGDTGTHEVGHWLGLYHTFQGGCTKTNDGISDTPASSMANEQCIAVDTCRRPKNKNTGKPPLYARKRDPIYNFMNYTPDSCMMEFTERQFLRMEASWALYREGQ